MIAVSMDHALQCCIISWHNTERVAVLAVEGHGVALHMGLSQLFGYYLSNWCQFGMGVVSSPGIYSKYFEGSRLVELLLNKLILE